MDITILFSNFSLWRLFLRWNHHPGLIHLVMSISCTKKKKSGCVRELTLGSSGSHSKKRELQSIWVLKERMFSLNIALRFCKDAQHYSLLVKCKSNDTTMRYHLISVRMAAIKKSTNNKCWSGCGEKGTLLHCLWEWKPIHPLRRTVWRFLKKLGIE